MHSYIYLDCRIREVEELYKPIFFKIEKTNINNSGFKMPRDVWSDWNARYAYYRQNGKYPVKGYDNLEEFVSLQHRPPITESKFPSSNVVIGNHSRYLTATETIVTSLLSLAGIFVIYYFNLIYWICYGIIYTSAACFALCFWITVLPIIGPFLLISWLFK